MQIKQYIRPVLVYFLYMLFFSMLQFFWPAGGGALGMGPDLQLLMAVAAGYLFGFKDGAAVGLSLGLIRDCLSARYFGVGLFLLFCVGALASVLLSKRWSRNLITLFVLVLIMTTGVELFTVICQLLIARNDAYAFWPGTFKLLVLQRFLPQVLLNVVATIPVFICFRYLGPYPRSGNRDRWPDLRREGAYLD